MNALTLLHGNAIEELESADETLRCLSATLDVLLTGYDNMENGSQIADVLIHIQQSVDDARAQLDDATGAVMQIPTSA